MIKSLIDFVSQRVSENQKNVASVIRLLEEGGTIPFISRYRKEQSGGLDEVSIERIAEAKDAYEIIVKRQQTILKAITKQEKMTPELKEQIISCFDLQGLEDIYLPFKEGRKTRADKAKDLGLEPLARMLMSQRVDSVDRTAQSFVKGDVLDVEMALKGACDIMACWVNERTLAREIVRENFSKYSIITSKLVKGKDAEADTYRNYFEFSERLKNSPSHRFLAMMRGETEGLLKVSIRPDSERLLERLERLFCKGNSHATEYVRKSVHDAYKRLLAPSLESETRQLQKEKADKDAVDVFAENLEQLLLMPPLGPKRILALDPGFASGCKLVCLDEHGAILHNETIYPHPPKNEINQSGKKINQLINAYKIEAVAIGNGTAGRETERFIKKVPFQENVAVYMVNEDGASVYSASSIARKEFPEFDVTVRGAISIGRRLMDPLAELVKIEPKAIGVGQYQHDVNQKYLQERLSRVVEKCVNGVGVNIGTASAELLQYVSGLGPQLAENIVAFRNENGTINSRDLLKKVPRMGAKTFEQCAGFIRIPKATNPLDNSAVHPESYAVVKQMAKKLGCTIPELVGNPNKVKELSLDDFITDTIGLPTLQDICKELEKPGRDPRSGLKVFSFAEHISSIKDLIPEMRLPGVISNVTRFGAFVDIGIKENGLIHISELKDGFVSDPTEVVHLGQQLEVRVLSIDLERKRIQLSLKGL
ncbi:MAG: hypothetical protein ACI8ZO_000780 [Flavobacteriales bacterium]|jgi:uncharacterized protein